MTLTDTFIPEAPPMALPTRKAAADALRLAAARMGRHAPAAAVRPKRPARRRAPAPLSAAERLPALAPADAPAAPRRAFVGIEMRSDAIVDEETRFAHREETKSDVARLTVYALNATLMVMAFPVGFALLVFNILGGENLRTTAHAIALTGLAIALSAAAGSGTAIFGII
ncbi:hypothetical protein ACRDNQ_14165 [Palleronia sp. KMU-117]|uniref:hypothetical protein n=1 Tax=Palleronia sp. KMU-117 TaxID=3434108 RepID=UPI003D707098